MLKKMIFVSLATYGCMTVAYGQQSDIASEEQANDVENNQRTIVLRRETKNRAVPVDTKVKVPVDTKPVIIVLPQQPAPAPVPIQQIVTPVITPVTVPAANNEGNSKKDETVKNQFSSGLNETRPAFFAGIEGGYLQGKFAESNLRNWQYGYRWTKTNEANAKVARAYVGYYIGKNVSAETGVFISTLIKGSRHTRESIISDYDTTIRLSGFDFMMKYKTESGFFVKGGYSYVESVARSYVEYYPDNVPTGQMRWTYGTESAMHVAAGAGMNLKLTDTVSLTLTAMHYQTVFTYFRNRFNLFTAGLEYKF